MDGELTSRNQEHADFVNVFGCRCAFRISILFHVANTVWELRVNVRSCLRCVLRALCVLCVARVLGCGVLWCDWVRVLGCSVLSVCVCAWALSVC
jgi:hypothetical protein